MRYDMRGVNNEDQAKREAILRMQINEAMLWMVEGQTGLEGIPITAGDVIDWASGGNATTFHGRVAMGANREEEYSGTTCYTHETITLPSATFSGNCQLIVRDPDDTLRTHTVSGPFDTATRSLTVSASATFNFLAPFLITRASGEIYQYRILQMQRSSDLAVAFKAGQYSSSAYYHADYDSGAVAI